MATDPTLTPHPDDPDLQWMYQLERRMEELRKTQLMLLTLTCAVARYLVDDGIPSSVQLQRITRVAAEYVKAVTPAAPVREQ